MDDAPAKPVSRRLLWSAIGIAVLVLLAWRGWAMWQQRETRQTDRLAAAEQRIAAQEERISALRADLRGQAQRLQDAAATNRVLRDEVLALSTRGALLEESVSKLADPSRHGAQALRLDEAELLLSQAAQRLDVAGDIEGARRAYALASGVLDGIDDPRLLNLRQALAQEREAVEALGNGPQAAVSARLDTFAQSLAKLPATAPANPTRPAWQRALAPLVDVRPRHEAITLSSDDRNAGRAALDIELGLARAALERDDDTAFDAALNRADAWLPKLWPPTPALAKARNELKALREAPLQPVTPVLGSTLQQLRTLRGSRPVPTTTLPAATGPAAIKPATIKIEATP
ncbi:MAG: uroporphyrinogen-III C-methyltransferase [Pseudoxanthomonas sp.]